MPAAHLLQLDIAWEDPARNHARVRDLLAATPVGPGDLILLPEMFSTGFSLNVERTADGGGGTQSFLKEMARHLGVTIVGGFTVLGSGDRALNRLHAVGPGGELLAQYDKIHPFSYGRESERFAGGREVVTFEWPGADGGLSVCPVICYDLRFPELFRRGLDLGAQAYAVIANWPEARAEHWRALLIARAIENQAFVLGVNRAGRDPHLGYAGGSIVVDPRGQILGEAGAREEVLSAAIDPGLVEAWRREFPAWKDRSPYLRQFA